MVALIIDILCGGLWLIFAYWLAHNFYRRHLKRPDDSGGTEHE